MIEKDHFDTFQLSWKVKFPATSNVQYDGIRVAEKSEADLLSISRGPSDNSSKVQSLAGTRQCHGGIILEDEEAKFLNRKSFECKKVVDKKRPDM